MTLADTPIRKKSGLLEFSNRPAISDKIISSTRRLKPIPKVENNEDSEDIAVRAKKLGTIVNFKDVIELLRMSKTQINALRNDPNENFPIPWVKRQRLYWTKKMILEWAYYDALAQGVVLEGLIDEYDKPGNR